MDDGILLVRLTYSDIKGRYMFPGGKVDPGESLEAALSREVSEEAGVIAEPQDLVAVRHRVNPGEPNTYLVFSMRYVSGEPRANGLETDAVAIVDAEQLRACSPSSSRRSCRRSRYRCWREGRAVCRGRDICRRMVDTRPRRFSSMQTPAPARPRSDRPPST